VRDGWWGVLGLSPRGCLGLVASIACGASFTVHRFARRGGALARATPSLLFARIRAILIVVGLVWCPWSLQFFLGSPLSVSPVVVGGVALLPPCLWLLLSCRLALLCLSVAPVALTRFFVWLSLPPLSSLLPLVAGAWGVARSLLVLLPVSVPCLRPVVCGCRSRCRLVLLVWFRRRRLVRSAAPVPVPGLPLPLPWAVAFPVWCSSVPCLVPLVGVCPLSPVAPAGLAVLLFAGRLLPLFSCLCSSFFVGILALSRYTSYNIGEEFNPPNASR
jgi:hypothetical protein